MMQAGFGAADITPEPGMFTSLAIGRPIDKIVTPLKAKVCLLHDGNQATVIVSVDTTSLYSCAIADIRRVVSESIGASMERIVVLSSHTHSSPFLHHAAQSYLAGRNLHFLDSGYYHNVLLQVRKAAGEAADRQAPVRILRSSGTVGQVACNRRVTLPNGTIGVRYGRGVLEELRAYPDGIIDPEVQCVWFTDLSGRTVGSLINYACHATSYNQYSDICWDYPGFATDRIERELGGTSLFLQGCAGNISPGKYTVGQPMDDCRSMGWRVAAAAMDSFSAAKPVQADRLLHAGETVMADLRIFRSKQEMELLLDAEIARCWKYLLADPPVYNSSNILSLTERILLLERYPDLRMPSEVMAVGFGNVRMVFFPGESFIQSALKLKGKFGHLHMMAMAYTDASLEYVPNAEAYEEIGGYETCEEWCFASKGTAERLDGIAKGLIESLG
jgi:hypothetical protein